MSDYSYLTGEGTPSLPELGTEVAASFVPGLNVAQALRDYKKAAGENKYVDMGLAALGLIPGAGGAAKAMLLAPAMLKRVSAAAKEVNKLVIPIHSTHQIDFRTPEGKFPEKLITPSFHVSDSSSLIPFGNDLNIDWETGLSLPKGHPDYFAPRDLTFVQKPGRMLPENNLGHIWPTDAMTPSGASTSTLATRKQLLANSREFVKGFAAEPHDLGWAKAIDFLNDPHNMWISKNISPTTGFHGELKLFTDPKIDSSNFAGALLDKNVDSSIVAKALRERGLKHVPVDFSSPEAMWDAANWLQQLSIGK